MSERNLKMKLQCPMPKFDFDIITLGHGSGGLLTNKLLDSGVFHLFDNDYLRQRHDGAVLKLDSQTAFTTDSFVISPIFFPDSNIGELAVNGTVNDLAMCGAIPQYLSLSFIIEEGLKMTEFWKILIGIKSAADKTNVKIVTGDTKVVEKGKGDKIFINTSGVGKVHERAQISIHNVKAGDKIIVSDAIATHGVAIMSVREGLEFETAVKSDTRGLNHIVSTLLDEFGKDIHLLKDPTRGGIATVLNEIARDRNHGVKISQKQIPIQNEVSALCEILGLDPLYVANEGVFIAVVDSRISEKFVKKLKSMDYGKNASVIGEVTESHPRQVVLTSNISGKQIVNMLAGEQLPRIC